jgi:hypothetical protein
MNTRSYSCICVSIQCETCMCVLVRTKQIQRRRNFTQAKSQIILEQLDIRLAVECSAIITLIVTGNSVVSN